MNKCISKSTIAIISVVMMFLFAMPAFAANLSSEGVSDSVQTLGEARANYFPYASSANPLDVTTSWRNIATSTTGFGCNIYIGGLVASDYMDVRMLDRNGNPLWAETNAFSTYGVGYRIFHCGSDVYTLQVRANSQGVAWAYRTNSDPT